MTTIAIDEDIVVVNDTDGVDLNIDWINDVELPYRRFHANKATRILSKLKPRTHPFSVMNMPLAFIDGEGANVPGPPILLPVKGSGVQLEWDEQKFKSYRDQNYSFLNVLFETPPVPGSSNYKYLACKDGSSNGRLSSYEILKWICELPPRYAYTAFYFSYDVEMWLRDLHNKERDKLQSSGMLHWKGFFIRYIPGKSFRIIRDEVSSSTPKGRDRKAKRNRERRWVKIWDMYGFFQMSFMRALEEWKLGSLDELAIIKAGKETRDDFSQVDERVREYARAEATLGLTLAQRVRDECKKLHLNLSGLHGAGAIADALYRDNGVGGYGESLQPPPHEIILLSYFGGRFDINSLGFVGTATEYDINSAYPEQIRNLPCLAHSRWESTREYQEDNYSLWYVRWNLAPSELWSPFPYRTSKDTIQYPRNGAGWYYGSEVRAARKLTPNIQVLGGYQHICECDHRPFAWIEDIYDQRQKLKQAGDLAEKILKLGMNSGYGKLAESRTNRPYYQNLLWAGMITAMTRGKLMEVVAQDPEAVVILATDAVYSTRPLDVPVSPNELGLWEKHELEDLFILKNGLYHSTSVNSKGKPLCDARRGYAEINWSEVREAYRNGVERVMVSSTSFMTWQNAMMSPKTQKLQCHWVREWKRLDFYKVEDSKEIRDGRLYPLDNEDGGPSHVSKFGTVIPVSSDYKWSQETVSIDDSLDVCLDDPLDVFPPATTNTSHSRLIIVVEDD